MYSYGLKSVNGVNRISGKGLDSDEVPGMMYGGGKWPGRSVKAIYNHTFIFTIYINQIRKLYSLRYKI